MLANIINFIISLLLVISLIGLGWYIIWTQILIHIPIVREVSGIDEDQKKTSEKLSK